jgi:hypothetical protein
MATLYNFAVLANLIKHAIGRRRPNLPSRCRLAIRARRKRVKRHLRALAVVAVLTGRALAQQTTDSAPTASSNSTAHPWVYSLATSGYIVPDSESYVSPDFSADRGRLHLEARYNNEALKTGSLWAGYNFSVGKKLVLDATPMVGGVFGNLNGIAPGYLITLTYKRVQLYSNGEYVIDAQNRSGSFFYCWNQITYSPLSWLQVGLAAQRTRVYETSLDVQRGVLVGFTHKKVNFTTTVFNFGWTTPTEVLSLGLSF